MLAVNGHIKTVSVPQAADNQRAVTPERAEAAGATTATELALSAANDDAAHSKSASEPSEGPSWLQDWARIWTTAASSVIDASAASLEAASAASAAAGRPEPAKPEVSLWSQPPRNTQPRSWYRPPQPNLLDPTAWGFPAPLAVYGVPVTPQMAMMGFNQMQPWSAMAQAMQPAAMTGWPGFAPGFGNAFGNAFGSSFGSGFGMPFHQPSPYANPFARQPENPMTAWMSGFAPQPVSPWDSLTKAMTGALTPAPYSSYRSDSGHAVAQIVGPAAQASSSAHEAVVAFWKLFA